MERKSGWRRKYSDRKGPINGSVVRSSQDQRYTVLTAVRSDRLARENRLSSKSCSEEASQYDTNLDSLNKWL